MLHYDHGLLRKNELLSVLSQAVARVAECLLALPVEGSDSAMLVLSTYTLEEDKTRESGNEGLQTRTAELVKRATELEPCRVFLGDLMSTPGDCLSCGCFR